MDGKTLKPSPITATVDYAADGVQHGFLRLPHSRNDSAWGSVMIPITVVKNGEGPTALLTGANHGDEYEGPLALFELANTLKAEQVSGRVIIVPAMNYPAFRAGTRTSPIDGGNLNRTFPGRPDGTVTEKIADYFQRVLLPLATHVLDFHSGGRTLEFLPFAAAHVLDDKMQEDRCFAAVKAFGAPYSMRMLEIDAAGMYDTAAEDLGRVFVTTELAGGGTSTPATVGIARRGLDQFPQALRHSHRRRSAGRDGMARHAVGRLLRLLRGRRCHRIAGRTRRPGEARPAAGAHLFRRPHRRRADHAFRPHGRHPRRPPFPRPRQDRRLRRRGGGRVRVA